MEGYVFVAAGLDEIRYFRLERTKIVERVLSSKDPNSGVKVLKVLPDSEIQILRSQLCERVTEDLAEGTPVVITQGVYARLEGRVVDSLGEDPNNILVLFNFRSMSRISKIPREFVEVVSGESQHVV